MKTAAIILAIVLIVTLLNVLIGGYVESNAERLIPYVEQAKAALQAGDSEGAAEQILMLKQEWDGKERLWEAFVDHRESEHVEAILMRLKGMIDAKTPEFMVPELEELGFFFEHITDKQRMLVENIF